MHPGFARAVIGAIGGAIGLAVIYNIIRALVGADSATGPTFFFAAFGGLFGWLWGVGSFNPYSHEHEGLERHYLRDERPSRLSIALKAGARATPGIVRLILPLIRPLIITLVICAVVVVVLLAITSLLAAVPSSPVVQVQTNTPEASVTTPAGSIMLPFGPNGTPVNKTVFFAIIVVIVLGVMGVLALVLALIVNALNREVVEAKAEPPQPSKTEPPLFRLIDFWVSWLNDILEGARRSVMR